MPVNFADPSTSTAERTLRLVELLFSRQSGWTPQELLVELELSRSSLFALLRGLKELGYIEQEGKRGRYVAGPRLLSLRSGGLPSTQDLLTAFYEEAGRSSEAGVGLVETLALVMPEIGSRADRPGQGILVLAQVEGSSDVRSVFSTGQVLDDLPAAASVLTDAPTASVRVDGFCMATRGEAVDLAVPVCRDGRTPEAAVLASAPAYRWETSHFQDVYLDRLRNIAAHLSYRLGASFYAPYHEKSTGELRRSSPLAPQEVTAFLRGPWAASLACLRPDGKPHVIPVWQEWDGQTFSVIAWKGSQWSEYLRQNPSVSLTVDEPWSPLRRVVVQGIASTYEPGAAAISRLVERMSRRYLGQSAPPEMAKQVERAFLIQPITLRGWQGLPLRTAVEISQPINPGEA